jgi:hypothetical protein
MRVGRIGGLLIVGGCALIPLVAVLGGSGPLGVDGHPDRDMSNPTKNAPFALLGLGAAFLSVAGPEPLHGRGVRVGLGMLAVGLLSLLVSSIIPIPAGSNDLQSWPYIIAGAVGLLATAGGTLVTVVSLVRVPGPPRVVGSLLLGGLLLFPFASILSVIGIFVGLMGIGVLAINGDRPATPNPG